MQSLHMPVATAQLMYLPHPPSQILRPRPGDVHVLMEDICAALGVCVCVCVCVFVFVFVFVFVSKSPPFVSNVYITPLKKRMLT